MPLRLRPHSEDVWEAIIASALTAAVAVLVELVVRELLAQARGRRGGAAPA